MDFKSLVVVALIVLPLSQLACTTKPVPSVPPVITEDAVAVAKDSDRFAVDLYGQLRGAKPGNLFFSPFSITSALAMTYAGAEGETENQMAEVLHFSLPESKLHPAFGTLRQVLNSSNKQDGYQLRVANRLWGQRGFHYLPTFLQVTRVDYGAELGPVDFAKQTETARQTINSWVEGQTEHKIQDLLAPGVLDSDARLVLTNAIYFKGNWTDEFSKSATEDAPFHTSADKQVNVRMMHQMNRFRYAAVDGLQLLELPYGQTKALSMFVLLPKIDGLSEMEERMTGENLAKWSSSMHSEEVAVFLPKFKMTTEFLLKDVLESMGMTLAFDPTHADFSGMTTEEKLYLSAVIHKAFVDVNEEGTEAAAATGETTTTSEMSAEPTTFRADHPFIFMIRDNRTKSILFMGRLVNPQE